MADHDGSRATRYLLVTLDLPDGSGGTADPDETTDQVADAIRSILAVNATVEDVYYGDIVGEWDPEDEVPANTMPPVPDAPTTPDEARDFIRWCVKHIGGGFHPDTSGRHYTNRETNLPTFTATEAHRLDAGLDAVFAQLDDPDPYTVTLQALIDLDNDTTTREDG